MTHLIAPELEAYCTQMSAQESPILKELSETTYKKMRYPHNMSGPLVGQTLKLLVNLTNSHQILEIGMFTGYAALSMAEALPTNGHITCCETNPISIQIAKNFFKKAKLEQKLTVLFGNAMETLLSLNKIFDLVFIDADKNNYLNYLQIAIPMIKKGGIIILDDALWRGEVINPQSKRSLTINAVNKYITEHLNLENVLLPIRHGLNIIRKLQ